MHPHIPINYLAIAAAIGSNMVLGFLCYGLLFGKAWAKEVGFAPDFKPAPGAMRRAMALMVVGAFLTAWVLANMVAIWRPSTWNAGADATDFAHGFFVALFIWAGFHVPMLFNTMS